MRGRSEGSLFPQSRHARRLRVSAVERRPAQRASLLDLARATLRSLLRHARLYLGSAVAVLALQGAFGLWSTSPRALTIVDEVLGGAFTALVTARTFGDLAQLTPAQVAERAFERSWAVILLGFAVDLIALVGMNGLEAGGIVNTLLASGVLLMTATLMFAPVDATISDEPWVRVVLSALSRSILAAWRPDVFSRALIVLALSEIAPLWLLLLLQAALQSAHVSQPALWASGLATAFVVPPVTAFATLVYLDAIRYEPKRTCND